LERYNFLQYGADFGNKSVKPINVLNKIQYNKIHDKFQTATRFGTVVPPLGNLLKQRNTSPTR